MEEKIISTFKKFKGITPRPEYTRDSLRAILLTPQKEIQSLSKRVWESIVLGTALALASLLLLVVIGGVSVNESRLAREPGFDIQIDAVSYGGTQEARQEVALRLNRLEEGIRLFDDSTHDRLLGEISALREVLSQ